MAGRHMSTEDSNASVVLDSLILEYLERKNLSQTAAAYRHETGLQDADPGIHALPYCFLSSWFQEFWENWYLKRSAGYQGTISQSQNPALNSAMTAAAGEPPRATTPCPPLYQSQASTRASTPSATSQYTVMAPPQGPQLGSRNSGSMVSPTSLASLQPTSSLHSTHSEPEDLLAMSQRLLANSSANGALSQRLGSHSLDLQAGAAPLIPSPFQQQASKASSATQQLGKLSMNGTQPRSSPLPRIVTSPATGSASQPPAQRNLSAFHSSGQADAAKALGSHRSAGSAPGQQLQQQQQHAVAGGQPFTQFTQDFAPFTTMRSGQLESPNAPLRARKCGRLHSAPSAPSVMAPPQQHSPHTPPSRKRKTQLQGEPPVPPALLKVNTGDSSLYGQGGEQLGPQRMSEGSEQTICSPQFMVPLELDFLNSLPPSNLAKPQHAHSLPAALGDQDCNLSGLDGLLPLLDDDDLPCLPGDTPRAGITVFQ